MKIWATLGWIECINLPRTGDVDNFIHQSCSCLKQRIPYIPIREPLQKIVSIAPSDLISIDFVHLETSIGGYQYILVVVDHFTKFAQAFPT